MAAEPLKVERPKPERRVKPAKKPKNALEGEKGQLFDTTGMLDIPYLVLTLLAEGAAVFYFRFNHFGPRIIVLFMVVILVTTAICEIFHYIHYVANKKPRII